MKKGGIVQFLFALVVMGALGYFFYKKTHDVNSVVSEVVNEDFKAPDPGSTQTTTTDYPIVPVNEYADPHFQNGTKMLAELKERYKKYFEELVKTIKATGAKPVVCWVTAGEDLHIQLAGKAYIQQLCVANGVEFDELGADFNAHLKEYTFFPKDGHFNKKGSQYIAGFFDNIISKFSHVKATTTYTDSERPELFGDQDPSVDEIRDGGKGLPYKLKTNKQGLRMNYALLFPKKKQRIIIIGDSEFFFPFVDNDETAPGLLQKKYSDKEFINCSNWGYSIDDYLSLWNERAKYTESDIILLQASGSDVTDLYFSNRLKFSRHRDNIKPTPLELTFYKELQKKAEKK